MDVGVSLDTRVFMQQEVVCAVYAVIGIAVKALVPFECVDLCATKLFLKNLMNT